MQVQHHASSRCVGGSGLPPAASPRAAGKACMWSAESRSRSGPKRPSLSARALQWPAVVFYFHNTPARRRRPRRRRRPGPRQKRPTPHSRARRWRRPGRPVARGTAFGVCFLSSFYSCARARRRRAEKRGFACTGSHPLSVAEERGRASCRTPRARLHNAHPPACYDAAATQYRRRCGGRGGDRSAVVLGRVRGGDARARARAHPPPPA
jgi:hypothetical protein